MKSYTYSDLRKLSHKWVQFNLTPMLLMAVAYVFMTWLCLEHSWALTLLSTFFYTLFMFIAFKSIKNEKVTLNTISTREMSDMAKAMLRYFAYNLIIFIVGFLFGLLLTVLFGGTFAMAMLNGTIGSLWLAILLSMIFIIALIYIELRLSMVLPLLIDRPSMTIIEAIRYSAEIMKGNVFEYFCFNLTYIGWIVLVFVTCGIASVYVLPLLIAADAAFYCVLEKKSIVYNEHIMKSEQIAE